MKKGNKIRKAQYRKELDRIRYRRISDTYPSKKRHNFMKFMNQKYLFGA